MRRSLSKSSRGDPGANQPLPLPRQAINERRFTPAMMTGGTVRASSPAYTGPLRPSLIPFPTITVHRLALVFSAGCIVGCNLQPPNGTRRSQPYRRFAAGTRRFPHGRDDLPRDGWLSRRCEPRRRRLPDSSSTDGSTLTPDATRPDAGSPDASPPRLDTTRRSSWRLITHILARA